MTAKIEMPENCTHLHAKRLRLAAEKELLRLVEREVRRCKQVFPPPVNDHEAMSLLAAHCAVSVFDQIERQLKNEK